MKKCNLFKDSLRSYLAVELTEADRHELRQHYRVCEKCRQVLELHHEFIEWGRELAKGDEAVDFESMRCAVLEQIVRPLRNGESLGSRSRWWRRLTEPVVLRPALILTAAIILLAFGVVAGQSFLAPPSLETEQIIREINQEAVANQRFADVEDSRYTYSNVAFNKISDDRIALGFDVTTHVEVIEPVSSPLVKDVLAHALLNPSPLGSRLEAISYAEGIMEPKIKGALIFSMHHDESLAVRLKALAILSGYPYHMDADTRSAVLATLREDEAVQMRLVALDTLANQGVDLGLIRRTIQENSSDSDPALLLRVDELYR